MFEALFRRGTLVTVTVFIVCIFGILATQRVPVQMIPDLEVRVISVQTSWPGATPQDVEKEIVIEQELYLRNIPNLRRMISTASMGRASIELEFPFGTDINDALLRVNNALSQVTGYPENVDEPRLLTSSFSDNAFLYFRVAPLEGNPRRLDMNAMRDFVDDYVRTRMERVAGVSEVNLGGGAERQIQVIVDPGKVAQRGLMLTDIRNAIRANNRDISGGDLDSGKRRYLLRTVGRFDRSEDLGEIILAQEGDSLVRLSDVAEIRMGYSEIRSLSYFNGQPVLSLSVKREPGGNVIDIREDVLIAMESINREVLGPSGMYMMLSNDDVQYVEASIANVRNNLIIGAILAAFVMYYFLRSVPVTLVGVMGIPICMVAAFLGLLVTGRTINVISLAGIAFAIGMTLDNTIVVLEAIEIERRRGLKRLEAALAGVRHVWPAVLASTLTTVLVFVPVLFVRQEAGQLYSDIAIAISSAIVFSMAVAIAVVPTACSRMKLPDHDTKEGTGLPAPFKQPILQFIGWLLVSRMRRFVCMGLTFVVTAGALLLLTPPAEYLPEGEEAKTFSSMIAPPGYNLPEMEQIARRVHEKFLPALDWEPNDFAKGEVDIPPLSTFSLSVQPGSLRVVAVTKSPAQIDALIDVITEHFRSYPGMRAFSSRGSIISSNDGGTRSVNLDISGPDLALIYSTGQAALRRAQEVLEGAQIGSSPSSLRLGQPLLELRPRRERLAEAGFDTASFGYGIAALSDGAFVDEFILDDDKVDIFLYSEAVTKREVDELIHLPFYTPDGAVLPVGSLAELVDTVDTDTIRRVDGRRTVTLNIVAPRSIPLETAVEMVETDVVAFIQREGAVAPSVSLDISGASDQLAETKAALTGNFLVSVVLCYLLLVVIFTHWGYPFLILITVPLGIAGGIIGLWLMNVLGGWLPIVGLAQIQQPFDMITMLGFLILLGTVVNNPILIVDEAVRNVKELGMSARAAVESAVETRLRPIMMTTTTTVCGLAPLVFIPGEGTELYRGVGAIVLFGLVFTMAVTLTFLPSLLISVLQWKRRETSL